MTCVFFDLVTIIRKSLENQNQVFRKVDNFGKSQPLRVFLTSFPEVLLHQIRQLDFILPFVEDSFFRKLQL